MRDIFWINGNRSPQLAIVLRPHGEEFLQEELRRFRDDGIDTLVSLLEPREAEYLGLGEEASIAAAVGLEFLSYPIPDRNVPADVASFRSFVQDLASRLARGQRIGAHCRGCIGRSTVTVACTLMHFGWDAQSALMAIARARGVPVPDTPEQEMWILDYEARR